MAEEEISFEYSDEVLPDVVVFSSSVAKGGENRLMIGIPAGFCPSKDKPGLIRNGESVNVTLEFPYRRIAKLAARINKVKEGAK